VLVSFSYFHPSLRLLGRLTAYPCRLQYSTYTVQALSVNAATLIFLGTGYIAK